MPEKEGDLEIAAIQALIAALTPLETDARERALRYVAERLGLKLPTVGDAPTGRDDERAALAASVQPGLSPSRAADIRSLREDKAPKSANEMAALVAYYLQYSAAENERKSSINADDIRKYFHQANFELPSSPTQTLINSKNSGYLDFKDRGTYSLNPVGYNLIVHRLPAGTRTKAGRAKGRQKSRSSVTKRSKTK